MYNESIFDEEFYESINNYITNLDISIAELEKVAVTVITLGYSQFFFGAEVDILDAKGINYQKLLADDITYHGQILVFWGYVLTFIVASKRVYEKSLRNNNTEDNFEITAFEKLRDSYYFSIISNFIRLEALGEIASNSNNTEQEFNPVNP